MVSADLLSIIPTILTDRQPNGHHLYFSYAPMEASTFLIQFDYQIPVTENHCWVTNFFRDNLPSFFSKSFEYKLARLSFKLKKYRTKHIEFAMYFEHSVQFYNLQGQRKAPLSPNIFLAFNFVVVVLLHVNTRIYRYFPYDDDHLLVISPYRYAVFRLKIST